MGRTVHLERGHAQRIAVRIAIGHIARARTCTAQHIAADRRVFARRRAIVMGHWRGVRHRPGKHLVYRLVAIGGRYGHAVHTARTALAGRVVDRAADEAGIRVDAQAIRQAAGAVGQRVAVHIIKVSGHIHATDDAAVLAVLRQDIANGIGGVVGCRNGNDQVGGVRAALAVADRVGHGRYRAIPVRHRREAVATVAVERQIANSRDGDAVTRVMGRTVHLERGHAQRIAVRIAIGHIARARTCTAQHIAADRRVFARRRAIVMGHWRGVRHRPGKHLVYRLVAIGGRYGHAVHTARTALAGRMIDRATDDAGVRIDAQTTWQARSGISQLVTIHIAEVARYVQAYATVSILARLISNRALGLRLVVDRRDRDVQLRRVRTTFSITDGIGHARHCTVPVRRGREAVATVAVEYQRPFGQSHASAGAVGRAIDGELGHSQCIAIRIVGQHVTGNGAAILPTGGRIVLGLRQRVGPTAPSPMVPQGRHATDCTYRTQQPRPPDKPAAIPFDLGEMKLRPLRRVLSPPDDTVVVFQHEVVATVFVGGRDAGCSIAGRCRVLLGMLVNRVLGEEIMDGDFLTILEYQHQIIAMTFVVGHTLRRQLQEDDRRGIQLEVPGIL